MADTKETAAKRTSPTPHRFMLSFGDKYAATHTTILKDAEADDREPGEYLVRWLKEHYTKNQIGA